MILEQFAGGPLLQPSFKLTTRVVIMYSAVGCLKFHCSLGATAIVGAFHNKRKEYPGSMDPLDTPSVWDYALVPPSTGRTTPVT